jgi:hypothetical protein
MNFFYRVWPCVPVREEHIFLMKNSVFYWRAVMVWLDQIGANGFASQPLLRPCLRPLETNQIPSHWRGETDSTHDETMFDLNTLFSYHLSATTNAKGKRQNCVVSFVTRVKVTWSDPLFALHPLYEPFMCLHPQYEPFMCCKWHGLTLAVVKQVWITKRFAASPQRDVSPLYYCSLSVHR